MPLLNWPPSKGPLPPHLRVARSEAVIPIKRQDFTFTQPPQAAAERGSLVVAAMETHDKPVEDKIGMELSSRKMKTDTDYYLDHPVAVVSRLTFKEADILLHGIGVHTRLLTKEIPARRYEIPLTYPLTTGSRLRVDPFELTCHMGDGRTIKSERMSIGYVLWAVAVEYKRIYVDWKHYKPWGHGIEDLVFRTMSVHRGNPYRIELGVAS